MPLLDVFTHGGNNAPTAVYDYLKDSQVPGEARRDARELLDFVNSFVGGGRWTFAVSTPSKSDNYDEQWYSSPVQSAPFESIDSMNRAIEGLLEQAADDDDSVSMGPTDSWDFQGIGLSIQVY